MIIGMMQRIQVLGFFDRLHECDRDGPSPCVRPGSSRLRAPAVGQQQSAQFQRRRRAVDPAAKTTFDEQRQLAAVIEMGVSHNDR
jgi:hypothetical protein